MIEILQSDALFQCMPPIQSRRILHLINRVMNGEFRHKDLTRMAEIDAVALSAKYMLSCFVVATVVTTSRSGIIFLIVSIQVITFVNRVKAER